MQDFFEALVFAYEQITKQYMMQRILMIGFAVLVAWGVVGYLYWGDLIRFSSFLIELVPFSFIRSNGAIFLSTFLYMQVVLVTFAFLHVFIMNLFSHRVKNANGGFIALSLVVLSAIGWGVVWFEKSIAIHRQLEKLLTWLPFETVEMTIAYLLSFYFLYNLVIMSMTLIVGLFSNALLAKVREREFPYDTMHENEKNVFIYTLRDGAIFMIASLLFFPLLFVPFLNFFAQVALWIWLSKDTLFYDSATLLYKNPNKRDFRSIRPYIWAIAFTGSLFNFIPAVNVFGAFFSEIAMFYYLKLQRDAKNV